MNNNNGEVDWFDGVKHAKKSEESKGQKLSKS